MPTQMDFQTFIVWAFYGGLGYCATLAVAHLKSMAKNTDTIKDRIQAISQEVQEVKSDIKLGVLRFDEHLKEHQRINEDFEEIKDQVENHEQRLVNVEKRCAVEHALKKM